MPAQSRRRRSAGPTASGPDAATASGARGGRGNAARTGSESGGTAGFSLGGSLGDMAAAMGAGDGLLAWGDRGPGVSALQRALGMPEEQQDGDFGPITHAAVVAFQRANGLDPDGFVGPDTHAALARRGGSTPAASTTTPAASSTDRDARAQDRELRSSDTGDAAAASGQGNTGRRNAVWTTGRPGGRGGVTSVPLAQGGAWGTGDWLTHHSDRSNSWAANNIRNGANRDLQAYDFTFERADANGNGIAGSAQGLDLVTPWDAKVLDIQKTFEGSGGYGKFIALEDVETGRRISVHHLDSVRDFQKGQIVKGGTVFGTQGGSGTRRHQYATHVDIVGTTAGVSDFVRANQTGEFRTHDS